MIKADPVSSEKYLMNLICSEKHDMLVWLFKSKNIYPIIGKSKGILDNIFNLSASKKAADKKMLSILIENILNTPGYFFDVFERSFDNCRHGKDCELFSLLLNSKNISLLIDDQDRLGSTALIFTIERGETKLAAELIAKKANLSKKNNAGKTALMLAIEKNNFELAAILIENGANPNDILTTNILIKAIKEKNNKMIAFLLDKTDISLIINQEDERGDTALRLAVADYAYHEHLMDRLISKGAKIQPALRFVIDQLAGPIAEYIRKYGIDSLGYFESRESLLESMQKLIQADQSQAKDLFLQAVKQKNYAQVESFLLADKQLFVRSGGDDVVPLIAAVETGDPELVSILLRHDAKVNNKDKNGNSALMIASKTRNFEMVDLLNKEIRKHGKLQSGISASYELEYQLSIPSAFEDPLGEPVQNAFAEIHSQVASAEQQSIYTDDLGRGDAAEAVVPVAEIEAGDNILGDMSMEEQSSWEAQVASLTAESKEEADQNSYPYTAFYHRTALMDAATTEDVKIVKGLLQDSSIKDTINDQDIDGRTALMSAVEKGNLEIISILLAEGARKGIDTQDHYGRTALMLAYNRGNIAAITLLLEAGSSLEITDKDNNTVFTMTKQNEEIIKLLQEKSKKSDKKEGHEAERQEPPVKQPLPLRFGVDRQRTPPSDSASSPDSDKPSLP